MIIKRKLFSFIDENGNLGYHLYNESTGEEKLFSSRNFIQKLALKGKYGVRKVRKSAADKLHESAKESKIKLHIAGKKLRRAEKAESELFNSSPQDRQAAMNLYRKGRNMGYTATHTDFTDVNRYVGKRKDSHTDFKTSFRGGRLRNPDDAKKSYAAEAFDRIENKKLRDPSSYILAKNLESGKNVISLDKRRPVVLSTASHELGHAINSKTENTAYKLRRDLMVFPLIKDERAGKKQGLIKSTLGDLATIIEEDKASENAAKLLKEAGASKEARRLAADANKHAGDTYKHGAAFRFKAKLRDMVDPIGNGNAYFAQKSRYAGKGDRYLLVE